MREVATELAVLYPAMFRGKKTGLLTVILPLIIFNCNLSKDDTTKTMDGYRPSTKVLSINSLAQMMIDRVRHNLFI
jgi:hypothetical protein